MDLPPREVIWMEMDTRKNLAELMAKVTPMMKQYLTIKAEHQDSILMYRLGDFYEMFFEDALTASHVLELTLTGRDCGMEERAPMCGVPYHALNTYLERLLSQGYKVAVCEQMEDPATAKGLVARDIVRIFTPGTINDPGMLDERVQQYLLCICFKGNLTGLAWVDVSTGEFAVRELAEPQKLPDEITRLAPKEMITNNLTLLRDAAGQTSIFSSEQPAAWFNFQNASEALCDHFHLTDLTALGLAEDYRAAACAAGALMKYLNTTQKQSLEHITALRLDMGRQVMLLDRATRRNLELTESLRGHTRRGSLLWLLDQTSTAMGGRLLRSWLEEPLLDSGAIQTRLDAVEELTQQHILTMTLATELKEVYDIERLLSKVSYRTLNARDCLALMHSMERIPGIQSMLGSASAALLAEIRSKMDPLHDICQLLESAIHPEPPITITDGGIIRDGYSAQLDEYRSAATDGKKWVLEMEQRERDETGIRNLRIQYNRVFGYYIEVTKSYLDMVPERYIRRQTLANAERYVTPELKELETKIVGAQEQAVRLEQQLFSEIREKFLTQIARIQQTAQQLKTLDALQSLAQTAIAHHYVRPEISEDGTLEIIGGRHPVVEVSLSEDSFVPNDTLMNASDARMMILTGPNMAGKSTYMRQVALIALMAQIGSFVPAQSAKLPVMDRIFTRIGASDDLASGQSTFMVEMSETANILRSATPNSLIILDEIGRGTSTFDGLAIAWAVVEYLLNRCGAKTLFATHYHELSELEGHLQGVRNYRVLVKEHGDSVIFLRRVERGGADKSYGVYVARLAGVPNEVVMRAHEIQAHLEVSEIGGNQIGKSILGEEKADEKNQQLDLFSYKQTELIDELKALDVNALTPMDAINQLFLLREKARKL